MKMLLNRILKLAFVKFFDINKLISNAAISEKKFLNLHIFILFNPIFKLIILE